MKNTILSPSYALWTRSQTMLKAKDAQLNPLADFFLNASAREKKAVYKQVLNLAMQEQMDMVNRHKQKTATATNKQ